MSIFGLRSKKFTKLEKNMFDAENYSQWQEKADQYDKASDLSEWKQNEATKLYDHEQVRHRLDTLRLHRARGDNQSLLFALNEGIHGNIGGMGNPGLYAVTKLGTKQLVEDYVEEVV